MKCRLTQVGVIQPARAIYLVPANASRFHAAAATKVTARARADVACLEGVASRAVRGRSFAWLRPGRDRQHALKFGSGHAREQLLMSRIITALILISVPKNVCMFAL